AVTSWPAWWRASTVAEPTLPREPVTRMRMARSVAADSHAIGVKNLSRALICIQLRQGTYPALAWPADSSRMTLAPPIIDAPTQVTRSRPRVSDRVRRNASLTAEQLAPGRYLAIEDGG